MVALAPTLAPCFRVVFRYSLLRWINALANKPNRKTVQLFHKSEGAAQEGEANTLALRLLDLAGLAFWHNRQEASRE